MLKIFNGCHTITNKDTGNHRTFRIKTIRKGALSGKRVLALLTGPNNEADYANFAFVNEDKVVVWKKFRGLPLMPTVWEKYAALVQKALIDRIPSWVEKIDYQFEGRCIRCNRKLTHPDSITTGIGPECAGKV